jgi:hypothetical protein
MLVDPSSTDSRLISWLSLERAKRLTLKPPRPVCAGEIGSLELELLPSGTDLSQIEFVLGRPLGTIIPELTLSAWCAADGERERWCESFPCPLADTGSSSCVKLSFGPLYTAGGFWIEAKLDTVVIGGGAVEVTVLPDDMSDVQHCSLHVWGEPDQARLHPSSCPICPLTACLSGLCAYALAEVCRLWGNY